MPITLDRSICCNLHETITREWLITNGTGAYASGTVAGMLTRMEQGLLVAYPPESNTLHLFLAKIDEEIVFDQRTYYLGTNEYRDGTLNPSGFVHLETFCLEEGSPVFTYRLGGIDGIMLEKRIWMQQGQDTTFISYRLVRTTTHEENGHSRSGITGVISNSPTNPAGSEAALQPLTLTLLPFTAYRPSDQPQHGNNDWHFHVQPYQRDALEGNSTLTSSIAGCTIRAWDTATPYSLLAVSQPESDVSFIPTNVWYWNFLKRQDAAAGKPALDDLYLPGVIRATLWPTDNSTLTIMVSTERLAPQMLHLDRLVYSYRTSVDAQKQPIYSTSSQRYFGEGGEAARPQRLSVLPLSTNTIYPTAEDENFLRSLSQGWKHFLIHRKSSHQGEGETSKLQSNGSNSTPDLLSEFYSMERRTRDTLVALPGLLLLTDGYRDVAYILRRLAHTLKQGMLPEILPLSEEENEELVYRSADLLLWYCNALDAYLQTTQDYELLVELYPHLAEGISWLIHGNEHGVKVDESDGLLVLSHDAATWMNAFRDGRAVTPRRGKPVEVNALWYNGLSLLQEWAQRLTYMGRSPRITLPYAELLTKCQANFRQKFWDADGEYLFDVIEGPEGNDVSLRPNQLLACSLRYPVATSEQHKAILKAVTRSLLTPYGLRTLDPDAEAYHGTLGQRREEQQDALHQGTVWTWLLGPYIDALYNRKYTPQYDETLWKRGLRQLAPFRAQLSQGMLDMIGGVFDGDYPHNWGHTLASLQGYAELLRAYHTLTQVHVRQPHLAHSR